MKNSSTCKVFLAQLLRVGDVLCCRLDIESCAKEASRLRGFCDSDLVEVCVNKSGGLGAASAFDLPAFSPSWLPYLLCLWPF
jgi:hypothetical protein